MMGIWEILGIRATNDIRTIKKAFQEKSKSIHPEEDPEAFLKLKEAYKQAMKIAETQLRGLDLKETQRVKLVETKEAIVLEEDKQAVDVHDFQLQHLIKVFTDEPVEKECLEKVLQHFVGFEQTVPFSRLTTYTFDMLEEMLYRGQNELRDILLKHRDVSDWITQFFMKKYVGAVCKYVEVLNKFKGIPMLEIPDELLDALESACRGVEEFFLYVEDTTYYTTHATEIQNYKNDHTSYKQLLLDCMQLQLQEYQIREEFVAAYAFSKLLYAYDDNDEGETLNFDVYQKLQVLFAVEKKKCSPILPRASIYEDFREYCVLFELPEDTYPIYQQKLLDHIDTSGLKTKKLLYQFVEDTLPIINELVFLNSFNVVRSQQLKIVKDLHMQLYALYTGSEIKEEDLIETIVHITKMFVDQYFIDFDNQRFASVLSSPYFNGEHQITHLRNHYGEFVVGCTHERISQYYAFNECTTYGTDLLKFYKFLTLKSIQLNVDEQYLTLQDMSVSSERCLTIYRKIVKGTKVKASSLEKRNPVAIFEEKFEYTKEQFFKKELYPKHDLDDNEIVRKLLHKFIEARNIATQANSTSKKQGNTNNNAALLCLAIFIIVVVGLFQVMNNDSENNVSYTLPFQNAFTLGENQTRIQNEISNYEKRYSLLELYYDGMLDEPTKTDMYNSFKNIGIAMDVLHVESSEDVATNKQRVQQMLDESKREYYSTTVFPLLEEALILDRDYKLEVETIYKIFPNLTISAEEKIEEMKREIEEVEDKQQYIRNLLGI